MKNYIWYLILCILSTLAFIYVLWKKKDRKLVTIYFFTAGVTYFLEYFVLVIFRAYEYSPLVLSNKYFDNILGAVVSDAFTIPMTATFVTGLKLNFFKRLILASIITMIEVLFVVLHIYKHYWWNYIYTFIGGNLFYYFALKWHLMLKKHINKKIRFTTLFFSNLLFHASMAFVLVGIFGVFFYTVPWFSNFTRGHVAFATLYIMLIAILFETVIIFKFNWLFALLSILTPSIIDMFLIKEKVLHTNDSWPYVTIVIVRALVFLSMYLFNKYLLEESQAGGLTTEYK